MLLCGSLSAQIVQQVIGSSPYPSAAGNTWTTSSGWSATGTTLAGGTCTNTCSAWTIPSTVAGDLLFFEGYSTSNVTGVSFSAGGSWVFPANCNVTDASTAEVFCGYVLSATGGVTSLQLTISSASNIVANFRSYHPSNATAVAETIPAASFVTNCGTTATPCNAPSVTLTGTSDLLISAVTFQTNGCNTINFSNFTAPSGDGLADKFNTSSGTGAAFRQATSTGNCGTATYGLANAAMTTVAFK